MNVDKRTHPRIESRYAAWIVADDGSLIQECIVRDVSGAGAKLGVEHSSSVPDEFTLLLPEEGRFLCRVVWRSDETIGVSFLPAS